MCNEKSTLTMTMQWQGWHGLLLSFPSPLPGVQPDLLVERHPVERGDLEHISVTSSLFSPPSTISLFQFWQMYQDLFVHTILTFPCYPSHSPNICVCPQTPGRRFRMRIAKPETTAGAGERTFVNALHILHIQSVKVYKVYKNASHEMQVLNFEQQSQPLSPLFWPGLSPFKPNIIMKYTTNSDVYNRQCTLYVYCVPIVSRPQLLSLFCFLFNVQCQPQYVRQ